MFKKREGELWKTKCSSRMEIKLSQRKYIMRKKIKKLAKTLFKFLEMFEMSKIKGNEYFTND